LAAQLNLVAIRIEEAKKQTLPELPESSNYANNISKPFFKIDSVSKTRQDSFT